MTDRRVVVFLGGTSGIGREAVKALLAAPQPRPAWHIIVGSRSSHQGLSQERGANSDREQGKDIVDYIPLDLARFESVRAFAAKVNEHVAGPIDVLVLCAGVICGTRRITEDGYEETVQVNALSEALLLDLLWPKLSAPAKETRVLVISSALHVRAAKAKRLKPSTLDAYGSQKRYRPMSAYADSKLLLMHIFFLAHARAQSGVDGRKGSPEVIALSPGFVPRTGLIRENGCLAAWASRWILPLLPFAKTPQQSGTFIASFITGAPIPFGKSRPEERAPLLPKSGAYVSISKGEARAAEECYDECVQSAWCQVLRERGLWHGL